MGAVLGGKVGPTLGRLKVVIDRMYDLASDESLDVEDFATEVAGLLQEAKALVERVVAEVSVRE